VVAARRRRRRRMRRRWKMRRIFNVGRVLVLNHLPASCLTFCSSKWLRMHSQAVRRPLPSTAGIARIRLAGGSLIASTRAEIECARMNDDARGRRRRFNAGGVLVINNLPVRPARRQEGRG
jgi:hypothetical protein